MDNAVKILVVDDEFDLRQVVVRLLKKEAVIIIEAATGQQALQLAESHCPDLVLLDVVLPDMDGKEVCRQIKANPGLAGCFVVLLSGIKTTPDDQAKGLRAGADGYIIRPIANSDLLAQIQAFLRIQQTEQALQTIKQEWEVTFGAMSDWVSLLDLEGRILRSNAAGEKLLGIPSSEIIGQICCRLVHGTVEPVFGCPLQAILRTRRRETIEFKMPDEDRWLLVTVDPVLDDDGKPVRAVHIVRDITERKQIETKLRDYSENLEAEVKERTQELQEAQDRLVQSHNLLLALSQSAQAVQRARTLDQVYKILGQEIAGLGYQALLFTLRDDQSHLVISHMTFESALLQLAEKVAGTTAHGHHFPLVPGGIYDRIISGKHALFFADASEPLAEALPAVVRSMAKQIAAILNLEQAIFAPLIVGDKPYGVLGLTGVGLTQAIVPAISAFANQTAIALENARLYQTLQESEEQYRTLIENQGEGVGIVDTTEQFIFANPAAHKIFGVPPGSLIGQTLAEFTDEESLALAHAQTELRAAGETSTYELQIVRPDGQRRYLLITGTPQFDQAGQFAGTFGVFRDITERKRAEAALQEAQEELIRSEKLATLGQLAGSVAHELRNPLGVLSNAAYYLIITLSDADETTREYLKIISDEIGKAQGIITDLLGFARTKTAEPEAVALPDIAALVLEKHTPPEDVQAVIDIDPHLPAVFVDSTQLEMVLDNLVVNAYQAMPDGGQLTISARRQDDTVTLAVIDTGTGILPEHRAKLFEPLFTTKAKGIGLGLALSQRLVKTNGGDIAVETEVGKGTTFIVRLPIGTECA